MDYELTSSEPRCKGLIYKFRENQFINQRGELVETKRFIPCKKLSCPRCAECDSILEELSHLNWSKDMIPRYNGEKKLNNGDLVRLVCKWDYCRESNEYYDVDIFFIDVP